MKIRKSLLYLSLLLTVGCSHEESPDRQAEQIIDFTVGMTEGGTRGQSLDGTAFPLSETFRVFIPQTQVTDWSTNGETVSYQATTGRWETATTHYWRSPQTTVDCYAVYPATETVNLSTRTLIYTVSPILSDQRDLMVASAFGQTKGAQGDTGIGLHFQHALAKIYFSAKVVTEDLDVEVLSLCLHNVCEKGVLYLPKPDVASASWVKSGEASQSYGLGMRSVPVVLTTDDINLTADNGMLMLIPQNLTPWNPATETIAQANADHHTYVSVNCRVKYKNEYFVGASDQFQDVYVPLNTNWEIGQEYYYTLRFGAGYNANGLLVLLPIDCDVSIAPWGTSENMGTSTLM